MKRKGLIVVFTGEGKGKTTAALGMALRAAGHNLDVGIFQFIKGSWHYGEMESIKRLPGVEMYRLGEGFTWKKEDTGRDAELAREGWKKARKAIMDGRYDMVILDEINYVFHHGFLDPVEVCDVLKNRPPQLHVVLTGNHAPQEIIDIADLVTEMRMIKHHYVDQQIKAQRGIEF
ncbi:cob(I)yrinic acid a,c-diamide adenosyltransferase [Thermodesulforhabdus norvegica]|uniref:corrinoid adenosyltransferase n=1 Tax=Thermodesulforhabdus norvegica TaxID=39841 RepID=A0A1I4VS90_9BACT|nr:cob(I)yrinic acid a,c-diamide adenosyltransferase [Thermodesulforhabdus norvegica]SFN04015.1 cob(I)yrinic acid a,c-diamide adenosyltransferase [Thermodesulforhabdus norvegica]